ncbi:Phytol kinase 1 [Monoraphidium neglectum]|uniref:phytol kinase n=1 Tax=Monoraphidium neglectum TaxID=145388 RepID=A0A0D2JKZ0_9CHLO|nr:Phytol kinase 1 [Monoraphidium neglectum]KIY99927.1 Phytol kinase 1 [Monoraphidium neglectum]|eukprot:XP_013898947.1 Phytol kinase 1 [Monoraphidium neglectum]
MAPSRAGQLGSRAPPPRKIHVISSAPLGRPLPPLQLYYVLVLVGATLVFWRDSPAGLIAISMMCGGDGLADIVGRRLGAGNRLPWNPAKSWAGSAAMFLGGGAMAMGFIALFCSLGFFPFYPPATLVPIVSTVCLVCTLIESLPINDWLDAAVGVSMLLLPLAAAAAVGIAVDVGQGVVPRVPVLALARALPLR